jgi:transcriptional regulator with XRE-family HTH domain
MTQRLGERLQQLRLCCGTRGEAGHLSARELDRLAGLSEGHTSLIEGMRNMRTVSYSTARALAKVFDVTTEYLFDGVGEPPSKLDVMLAVEKARQTTVKPAAPKAYPRGPQRWRTSQPPSAPAKQPEKLDEIRCATCGRILLLVQTSISGPGSAEVKTFEPPGVRSVRSTLVIMSRDFKRVPRFLCSSCSKRLERWLLSNTTAS